MKKYFVLLLLTSVLIFSHSCSSDETTLEENFIFGSYNGFCQGNCAHLFLYQDGKVYRDNIDRFEFVNLSFSDEEEQDLVESAERISSEFPDFLESSSEEVFGCPGCIDQGTLFIQKGEGDAVRSWYIDPILQEDWPLEMTEFVEILREELNEMIIF